MMTYAEDCDGDDRRTLARQAAPLLLLLSWNAHDPEYVRVASHVAVQPVHQLACVALVGFAPLASLIPTLRYYYVIDHSLSPTARAK